MSLHEQTKLEMFRVMLLARRLDERAWTLHSEKKISFHVSCIGHEAAQVGAAFALQRGHDWAAPYYRDLALMLSLGYRPLDVFLGWLGKGSDPASGGRQMPNHWSSRALHILPYSAITAASIPHAVGAALAAKMNDEESVVLAACGEGATSQGDWYEAVNLAAVQQLPIVFLIENNGYAISTPLKRQLRVSQVAAKASGLGLPGQTINGKDPFAVLEMVNQAVELARSGSGPSLVEVNVYRPTPHSSDDDDRLYRAREDVLDCKQRDPLRHTRLLLENEGLLTADKLQRFEDEARSLIEDALQEALQAPYPKPAEVGEHVYA
ncbi:MAG: thiamine pyrophosphate-dependent dehydrogenase E1 component subunit alpha [Anaerolineaceae bacterium]|nr:thiamine pyrophosphate-dependent dehydrogenase E1 component subunit alpha [Anaerolineaceae bacterium]